MLGKIINVMCTKKICYKNKIFFSAEQGFLSHAKSWQYTLSNTHFTIGKKLLETTKLGESLNGKN